MPSDPPHNDETPTYEALVERLEEIVERMESGQIGLEQLLREYEQGVGLIKQCRAVLDQAELKIRTLSRELDSKPVSDDDPK